MNKTKLAIGFAILSASANSFAQPNKSPMAMLDSDGDGNVSFAEFEENDFNPIARIDLDENGVLTLDELLNAGSRQRGRRNSQESDSQPDAANEASREERRAKRTQRITESFQEMDLDGDEVVSVSEFNEANFLRMDKDGNGVLSPDELRPPRGSRGPKRRGEKTPPA